MSDDQLDRILRVLVVRFETIKNRPVGFDVKAVNVRQSQKDLEQIFGEAKSAIQSLIISKQISELERLKNAHSIAIFDEYLENRINLLRNKQ